MGDEDTVGATAEQADRAAAGKGEETTEVEWQFDALDLRPVERWLAALPSRAYAELPPLTALAKPARRLVDRYMDTADWRIARAGFVLRTRRRGRAVEVTMKALKQARPQDPPGLRERLELTEELPSDAGPASLGPASGPASLGPASGPASLGPKGPVGRRVHAVAGRRPLVQVLEVRTRRLPFSLRAAGAEVAEVALDETTIALGPHQAPARLRRVEVEVAPGWLDALAPVVRDLRESAGLSPAVLSKFEAGLLAAGLSVPGPPDVGPTDIPSDATLGDIAYAVIRSQLRELFAREPGARLGEDPEELHDMRVATRRLRAAMDVFSSALPSRAVAVREELRWIAAELGQVRDLDVQLEGIPQMSQWSKEWTGADHGTALAHLQALLEAERDEARRKLLDALDSARWERLTAALLALARQGPSRRVPGARIPAAIAVPPLLEERHRATVAAARRARRSGIAHDFHRVRIRGKRLRYCLEFASPLYGRPAQRFVTKLTRLQDQLGRMQDAEVASSRLFSMATETPPPGRALPPATVFVMGGIAERYRQTSAQLREVLPRRLGVLRGKAWRELEATVAQVQRRAEALGAAQTQFARPARGTPAPRGAIRGAPRGAIRGAPGGATLEGDGAAPSAPAEVGARDGAGPPLSAGPPPPAGPGPGRPDEPEKPAEAPADVPARSSLPGADGAAATSEPALPTSPT